MPSTSFTTKCRIKMINSTFAQKICIIIKHDLNLYKRFKKLQKLFKVLCGKLNFLLNSIFKGLRNTYFRFKKGSFSKFCRCFQ